MAYPRTKILCSRPTPDYVLTSLTGRRGNCPPVPERPGIHLCPPNLPKPIPKTEKCPFPINTLMCQKQTVKPRRPKPDYKGGVVLGDGTLVGQVWPIMFRVRRIKTQCKECDHDLFYRETVTDGQNVMVLDECCKVKVYPWNKLMASDRVPVNVITGPRKISKKTITVLSPQTCIKEEEPQPPPPPPPKLAKMSIARHSRRSTKKHIPRKSKKTSKITIRRTKTYRVHESTIYHSGEEVKERKLREANEAKNITE